jgi:chromosome segregation ATPase
MKSEKELRKEIDKILADKVGGRIKEFQLARDKDFKEVMTLNQTLETIEGKKAGFLKEKSGLNTLINKDLARWNYLEGHIPYLQKQAREIQDRIEKITQNLTEVEIDPKTLNFFLNFKS